MWQLPLDDIRGFGALFSADAVGNADLNELKLDLTANRAGSTLECLQSHGVAVRVEAPVDWAPAGIHPPGHLTQKSAWFMLHRIRKAMESGSFEKMKGRVEVDETFIGGAARFMHKDRKGKRMGGKRGGMVGKTAVMGLLERHGPDKTSRVRAFIVPTVRKGTLGPEVRASVTPGSEVITDALKSYDNLEDTYTHNVIDHAESYVRGHVHTNGLENFWSLLKRALKGTYVEPWHLSKYLDEEVFRYNERRDSNGDGGRFAKVLRSVTGRRLDYKTLTGKTLGFSPA